MALEIDKTFEKLVEYLVEHEAAVATAIQQQGDPRPWMNFSGDGLKVSAAEKTEAALDAVFDRESMNQSYVQARSDEAAKSSEVALAKIAGDFLGAFERDKRMQWRSRIRMVAHAAARRAGNGKTSGPLRRNTVDYLERMFLKSREKVKQSG